MWNLQTLQALIFPPEAEPRADVSLDNSGQYAFARLWRAFMNARVAIALLLLAFQALQWAFFTTPVLLPLLVCTAYLGATLAVRLLAPQTVKGSAFDRQWMLSIGIDAVVFAWLQWVQLQPFNYAPLLALPVLLAAVMGSITLSTATAAAVTLYLLGAAWHRSSQMGQDAAAAFMQAGLTGAGYFALAVLANQLAQRLLREQEITRRSQTAVLQQTQVNELVIQTLVDGVMVVDLHGTVQSVNPAGRSLLMPLRRSLSDIPPFSLGEEPGWRVLAELAQRTFVERTPQAADIVIQHPQEAGRRLRVKTRLTRSDGSHAGSLCVVFLQDLPEIEARMRQDKIIAMGRMSAAVAHEIRNPLAAISQANDLLAEDLTRPADQRLSQMIAQNAERLARIVDDILNLARVPGEEAARATSIALDENVGRIAEDWAQQHGTGSKLLLSLNAPAAGVVFEIEHMRRILVNLLDNAVRYSTNANAAIVIFTRERPDAVPLLVVWSDGRALEPTVQKHLFEPFFSSESRSSGLGLYICRELCEQHGAVLGYAREFAPAGRNDAAQGNSFFIVFRTGTPASQRMSEGAAS